LQCTRHGFVTSSSAGSELESALGTAFAARTLMATSKKGSKKKTGSRRYGKKAASKVERSMHEMKRGQLRSGGSNKKVTSRKQAIAIGLSEARAAGGKVPAKKSSKKSGAKKKSSKKRSSK
jgi:hypothetical protein